MNSFWTNAYNDAKDRRYARLFFVTLLLALPMMAVFALLGANLSSSEMQTVCEVTLPAIILIMALVCWRWIHIERKYARERLKCSALSRDELAKARLKLKYQARPVRFKLQTGWAKRAAPRVPDTNLKY